MTTTTDRTAFELTIDENQDDPTPRLVYADWLDERSAEPTCSECGGRGKVTPDYGFQWYDCPSCGGHHGGKEAYRQLACDQRLAAKMIEIRAKPDDDALRLEWADIAERYGREERAEFIRVQVEVEMTKKQPGWTPSIDMIDNSPDVTQLQVLFRINNHERESKLERLRRRGTALFHEHWREPGWGAGVLSDYFRTTIDPSTFVGRTDTCAFLSRGFISTVALTLRQAREHLPTICREHPVTRVDVTDSHPIFDEDVWIWTYAGIREHYLLEWDLPDEIYRHLDTAGFNTEEDAMLALGRAVLKWAKGERR